MSTGVVFLFGSKDSYSQKNLLSKLKVVLTGKFTKPSTNPFKEPMAGHSKRNQDGSKEKSNTLNTESLISDDTFENIFNTSSSSDDLFSTTPESIPSFGTVSSPKTISEDESMEGSDKRIEKSDKNLNPVENDKEICILPESPLESTSSPKAISENESMEGSDKRIDPVENEVEVCLLPESSLESTSSPEIGPSNDHVTGNFF